MKSCGDTPLLDSGAFEHPEIVREARRTDGGIDARVVLRVSDGKKFKNDISPSKMAAQSPYSADRGLFDGIYGRLSRQTHPNVRSIDSLRTQGRLAPVPDRTCEEEFIHTLFFAALIAEQVFVVSQSDSKSVRADIEFSLRRWVPMLAHYLRFVPCASGSPDYPHEYLERLKEIEIPSVRQAIEETTLDPLGASDARVLSWLEHGKTVRSPSRRSSN